MVMYFSDGHGCRPAYRMIFVPGAVLNIISERPSPSKS